MVDVKVQYQGQKSYETASVKDISLLSWNDKLLIKKKKLRARTTTDYEKYRSGSGCFEQTILLEAENKPLHYRSSLMKTLLTYLLTYLLTPWCRVLLEQLTGQQLIKKFTEPEGSLSHSQAYATCLYPRLVQSSPYTHIRPPGDPS